MNTKLLTLSELAIELKVKECTIYKWIEKNGSFPKIKVGRTYRFNLQDVLNYWNEQKEEDL